jgi:PAS domain-containing protein
VIRPDGQLVWVEAHGIATFDGEGPARRATSLVGTVADVTARKRAEAELRESTTLLRAISDTSEDVIFAKDRSGRVRFANPATLALVGKPLDAVLGRTDLEILEDAAAARASGSRARRPTGARRARESGSSGSRGTSPTGAGRRRRCASRTAARPSFSRSSPTSSATLSRRSATGSTCSSARRPAASRPCGRGR